MRVKRSRESADAVLLMFRAFSADELSSLRTFLALMQSRLHHEAPISRNNRVPMLPRGR